MGKWKTVAYGPGAIDRDAGRAWEHRPLLKNAVYNGPPHF